MLSLLWAHGEMQALAEKLLVYASSALAKNRETIRTKVSKRTSRLIPKWIDGIVADKIIDGVLRILEEMREPSHPWRIEMTSTVEHLIGDLAAKPELIEKGEELKAKILAAPAVTGQIDALWVSIENRLEIAGDASPVVAHAGTSVDSAWASIQDDEGPARRHQPLAPRCGVAHGGATADRDRRIHPQCGRELGYVKR